MQYMVHFQVSSECSAVSDVSSCCSANPSSCNDERLRQGAGEVFDAYFQQIPRSTSCDFGGVAYLNAVVEDLECEDGYDENQVIQPQPGSEC